MINLNNLNKIKDEIGTSKVRIVAATKTVLPNIINLLPNYGITAAGENTVQEFLQKYPLVSGIDWHFIGRLQSNKVKYIIDKVSLIHSVDRKSLVDEIELRAGKKNIIKDILIEVKGGEGKGGVLFSELFEFADYITLACPHVSIKGIMCIPDKNSPTDFYKSLQGLSQEFLQKYPNANILSAGMSGDYSVAIKHGANMIRPGSILFGDRKLNC